jgi:hypothetical protein
MLEKVDDSYKKCRRRRTTPAKFFWDESLLPNKILKVGNNDDPDVKYGDDVHSDGPQDTLNAIPHSKTSSRSTKCLASSLFPSMNESFVTTVDMTASTKEFVEGLCVIAPSHRSIFLKLYGSRIEFP